MLIAGRTLRGGSVDAALLRELCVNAAHRVDPRGLRLAGVRVRNKLDLAGVDVGFPLRFEGCTFDEAPDFTGGSVRALAITGATRLPGLFADGVHVRGDLDLSWSSIVGAHPGIGSRFTAAVWLRGAEVGRRLLLDGSTIDGQGGRTVRADRIKLGGSLRLTRGFVARGEIRVTGARVGASFEVFDAQLEALDLSEATIGGGLLVTGSTIGGRITAGNVAVAGRVLIRDARLAGVDAPRLSVAGPFTVEGATRVEDGLELSYGDFTTVSIGGECRLEHPGGIALDLGGADVRSHVTLEARADVAGTVRVADARIRGNLALSGVTLREPMAGGALLAADQADIGGEVQLNRLSADGGYLGFRGAVIGGAVNAARCTISNGSDRTVFLFQAVVRNSVRLWDGFSSTGYVVLNRCTIEGRLNLRRGSFTCPGPSPDNKGGHAIQAVGAAARGGAALLWTVAEPSVDFRNLTTTVLEDDPERWPERIEVSGMTYDRFGDPRWDRAARLRWLRRQVEYDAGPYEQLARVFRRHGYTADAEAILIERRDQARRAARRHRLSPGGLLDAAYGRLVGYGYRAERTAWLLLVLLIAVSASLYVPAVSGTLRATDPRGNTYAVDGRVVTVDPADPGGIPPDAARSAQAARSDACGDGQVRCFNPVLYAVDTVVPLISLGQRTTWYPSPHTRYGRLAEWWLNLATLAGWLLSTMYVLSFTKLARSA
ncbi:hypothetical protein ACQP00_13975 [Dactylosporangium sp. CS-047395]|uniref:hypothetical protein n=1 Tax=Dactylosporangium sp. CS-047395 TaxID=3239936 RepID=UPI003D94FB23